MSDTALAARVPLHRRPLPHKPPFWLRAFGTGMLLLAAAIIIFLLLFEWNWLRGPIGRFASARLDRTVQLRGDLDVHPFSWSPRAEINDLFVADADWGGRPHLARVERIEVAVKLLPLFRGQVILPRLAIIKPDANLLTDARGRSNFKFGDPDKPNDGPTKLPAIQQLLIDTGTLRFDDAVRAISIRATVDTNEQQGEAARFRLRGTGSINREPFTMAVIGGPLLSVSPTRPYPFDADIRAGRTHLTARGQVDKPFDLGRISSRFTLEGPDLNQLYGLTGLALPNTPPYRLSGDLTRRATLYDVDRFAGRIGDSDIGGDLAVETKGERPRLTADLVSRRVDFDDLATIFGGAPDPSETASDEQKRTAARLESSGRLFPDSTLQVERIRAMDADVRYRATAINAPGLPLKDVALAVDLKAGLLKVTDLALGFPQGRLTGTAQLDARNATPLTDIDLRVSGLALQQFLTKTGASPVTGNLAGRAQLRGSGNSIRRAMASADGAVTVVVPRGEIREAFAELAGINVLKGLGLLLSRDQGRVALSCAIADFRVTDGVMRSSQLLADTEPVLITGGGQVSLRDERLDLEFKGNPKRFRLISLNVPVTLGGTLKAPDPGVRPGGAIAQGGIGAALLAVVHPLAAILPFVDPGLTEDANCSGLLNRARGQGAPVTRAQVNRAPSGR